MSGEPWTREVEWVRGNLLEPQTYRDQLVGAAAAISCVGGFGSQEEMLKVGAPCLIRRPSPWVGAPCLILRPGLGGYAQPDLDQGGVRNTRTKTSVPPRCPQHSLRIPM